MLGIFSEPIKIYFLIWSVAHFTSRYGRLCGSNGGHGCCFRVDQLICRFSTFLGLIKKIKRFFFKLLVQYQACRFLKSSIAGKHFFVSKQVWKSCCVANIICWTRAFDIPFFGRLLGDRDQCIDYFCMEIYRALTVKIGLESWGFLWIVIHSR